MKEKLQKMTPFEIAQKYVYGEHDALTDNQEIIDMTKDIKQSISEQLLLRSIMEWVTVKDDEPKEFESIIGIEMPYETRYACHREGNLYISDETGESVAITHWIYSPKSPCV